MTRGDAFRHLAAFASVGVHTVTLAWLNPDSSLRTHLANLSAGRALASIDFWAEGSRERATGSLIVRPRIQPSMVLIQLDDVSGDVLERTKKISLLSLATSDTGRQVWLAVGGRRGAIAARYLRKSTGADRGASGACRVAGSRNCKAQYAPEFPIVRLLECQPGRVAEIGDLGAAGLLQPGWDEADSLHLESVDSLPPCVSSEPEWLPYRWPSYEDALQMAPGARGHRGPDRSRADFFWCLLAFQAGWDFAHVRDQLMQVSRKAAEKGLVYADRSVLAAWRAAAGKTAPSASSPVSFNARTAHL